jgi:hypothetical protein
MSEKPTLDDYNYRMIKKNIPQVRILDYIRVSTKNEGVSIV